MTLNYEESPAFSQNVRADMRFNVSFEPLSLYCIPKCFHTGGHQRRVNQTLPRVLKSAKFEKKRPTVEELPLH